MQDGRIWFELSYYKNYSLRGTFNKFPDFFVLAFKIIVDSRKFSMLLLYTLWDARPIFMISGSNEQLQQQLEYTLLKPDCHSGIISKMQSGREENLEERYAIKFCFKLGKSDTEMYRMLHIAFGLELGLLCWGFKGVQQEIPSEGARTFQVASVAFLPGQCTSPRLHPYHRLFDQDGHQDSSSASL